MIEIGVVGLVSFCFGFYLGRGAGNLSADLKEPLLVIPHFTLGGEGAVRVTLRNELTGVVLMTMRQSPVGAVTVAPESPDHIAVESDRICVTTPKIGESMGLSENLIVRGRK